MKIIFYILLILIVIFTNYEWLFAMGVTDSVRKKFPEVVVTTGRIASNSAFLFSPMSVINKSEIEDIGAWQASDALTYMPGVFIRNYGGLGGLKTISMRGTSSQQTLIMIDGIKINSTQNGMFDFSIFPVSLVEGMEIVRGGNSALFGGNSIGGVINLRTSLSDNNEIAKIGLHYGSFNERYFNTATKFTVTDNIKLGLIFEYTKSDGNYSFSTNQFGKLEILKRENGDFENLSLSFSSISKVSDWNLKTSILCGSSGRGTPGAVVQGNVEAVKSRLNEKDIIGIVNAEKTLSDESYFQIGGMFRINNFIFSNPVAIGDSNTGFRNSFTGRDVSLSLKYFVNINNYLIDCNVESGFSDLRGNMLQPSAGDYVKRTSLAASTRVESSIDFTKYIIISYHAGLRYDYIAETGNAISPLAGIILKSNDVPLSLRFQWSYNFRPPSFNEMYYLNYGSTKLKPERSHSFNLGISSQILEAIRIEAETFYLLTSEQIIAQPNSPRSWSAYNIGKVNTKGFELSLQSSFLKKLFNIRLSYTRQKATDESEASLTKGKQIIYVPQELLASNIYINMFGFMLGCDMQYSSFYYTLPDNAITSVLPSYVILNASLSYKINLTGVKMKLRLECNNLFDEQYAVIRNYPMPGRYFRAGFEVSL